MCCLETQEAHSIKMLLFVYYWVCLLLFVYQTRKNPSFVIHVEVGAGNVLLLRNNLNLGPDATEVSQEKLLSLVAERLIDSNSNVDVSSILLIYSMKISTPPRFHLIQFLDSLSLGNRTKMLVLLRINNRTLLMPLICCHG